jgi:hypothetical protein
MSVFLENERRGSDYETEARLGRSTVRRSYPDGRPIRPPRREDAPLWGFSYDRAESVIHLLLAFTMVGGAAAVIWHLAPEVEKPAAPVKTLSRPAPVQPLAAAPKPAAPTLAKVESAKPVAPAAPEKPAAPALAAAVMSPTPISNAPAPLPPPAAELREKLAEPAGPPAAPMAAEAAPIPVPVITESEPASPETVKAEPKAESSETNSVRSAHCYLKLSGRVQANASCKVQITDNGIIFQLPGKPLEITHDHGRTWLAALGGRSLGKVYKSGSCWGGHGFYACKNG